MKQSITVLMLLGVNAHTYRPHTDGRTPWYKTYARAPSIEFPHDYPVPNFGEDKDISVTKSNSNNAEKQLNHKWTTATFAKPAEPPRDYPVPNFGKDHDILTTQKNLADSEVQTGHKWVHATFDAPAEPPRNYFVPNLGMDHDVKETLKHVGDAEVK